MSPVALEEPAPGRVAIQLRRERPIFPESSAKQRSSTERAAEKLDRALRALRRSDSACPLLPTMASSASRSERDDVVDVSEMAPALRERLGPGATMGLLSLLDGARETRWCAREWSGAVTTAAVDRFELRLIQEVSGLRVALGQTEATLRTEMAGLGAALRKEISDQGAAIRTELHGETTALRKDIAGLVRWSFVFWVGQVLATVTIVGVMLQGR
jgi:hypothetical protein